MTTTRPRGESKLEDEIDLAEGSKCTRFAQNAGDAPGFKVPVQPVEPLPEYLQDALSAFKPKRVSGVMQLLVNMALLFLGLGMVFLLLNPSSARLWADQMSVGMHAGFFGGPVFDLIILCVLANLGGQIVARMGLPPLAGMLLMGFVLRQAQCTQGITSLLNSKVRDVALAVIMARAGLGLDLGRLWTERGITTALSTIPMLVEASTIALTSWATGALPLSWGLLLGFIIADVSPAVTVPLLMEFEEAGYGADKGIPSILLAASGLNSVAAIVGYGTVFSILFSSGEHLSLPSACTPSPVLHHQLHPHVSRART